MADLMTAVTDSASLENKYGNFVLPAVRIKSSGSELISSLDISVLEMNVTLSLETAGMAVIKIGGAYDVESHSFNSKIVKAFKLGTVMSVELGYVSDTTEVFKGYVAGLGAEFRENSLLVVKLMDVRKLMMSSGVKRQLYEDKNYSDIFNKIMSGYSKLCSVVCDSTKDELVSPVSQSTNDFDFVNRELIGKGKSDREFFVLNDKAYFRERGKNKTPIMTAELGNILLRFSMMADYLDTEINVVGYDPVNCKSISSKVSAKTKESCSSVLSPTPSQFFIDADADSEAKAKTRAEAIAKRMQMQSCFAEGETVGLPEIVPGRYIEIKNLDTMADRKYYISEVRHSYTPSSFTTFFETKGWI
ncbi:MAG: hypothetical protein IKP95_02225 [Ruminococcus sp.]|nr:hypothetical protein [Ruminococcus sp.]